MSYLVKAKTFTASGI